MLSELCVRQPRLAIVVSLVITLVGVLAVYALPVALFPTVAPPIISVTATYPGADAETVANTVGAPLESQINGVEDMLYISSTSSSQGEYDLQVTFQVGADPTIAQVNTQNRISQVQSKLPQVVQDLGITVQAQAPNLLYAVDLISPDGRFNEVYLSNYATIHVLDPLARVDGVGQAELFAPQDYSMRVWLDPAKLNGLGLSSDDVVTAIEGENLEASLGSVGGAPSARDVERELTIVSTGQLSDPKEFENIILRTSAEGAIVRLRDVARVELGSTSYSRYSRQGDAPAASVVLYERPGGNALTAVKGVEAELERIKKRLPDGMELSLLYDSTQFIRASIREIITTLAITAVVVILVVFVFLGSVRATVIPAVTIPVCLIGTFAVLYALGYSANTITLFALVLAVGLVVDDAIVVVENVHRVMEDEDLPPREATLMAMRQVQGPIISTTLVLFALFCPLAFFPGLMGELFRQFAVTILAAVSLSALNALTLSPAMCALVLSRPKPARGPLGWFSRGLDVSRAGYVATATWMARRSLIGAVVVVACIAGSFLLLERLPGGFIPEEDQGFVAVNVDLPGGSSLARTERVVAEAVEAIRDLPQIRTLVTVSGFSILTGVSSPDSASLFVNLKPWAERGKPNETATATMATVNERLGQVPDAVFAAFMPPTIMSLGMTSGFDYRLLATAGQTPGELAATANAMVTAAKAEDTILTAFTDFAVDTPQLFIKIDRETAASVGLTVGEIYDALQANFGTQFVNYFTYLNRQFEVNIEADGDFRSTISDLENFYIKTWTGNLVPFQVVARVEQRLGPQIAYRYNLFPSARIIGQQSTGSSIGEAVSSMEALSDKTLSIDYSYEWSTISFQEINAGGNLLLMLILSLLFGYLFLVALYESWMNPLSVITSVVVAILGAVATFSLLRLPETDFTGNVFNNNLYFQIGLLLLVGLAAKNAILMVEFAREQRLAGATRLGAGKAAAFLRFRAVVMTATAFAVGLVPLVLATGPGSASRIALGTTVLSGIVAATLIGILFIPALYVLFQWIGDRVSGVPDVPAEDEIDDAADGVPTGAAR